ncbi:hypothetical protein QJS66_13315 [Kocuria rhizophila]|nr:hypothetical protein QJS66_13315 [Kocuria rhizophila]
MTPHPTETTAHGPPRWHDGTCHHGPRVHDHRRFRPADRAGRGVPTSFAVSGLLGVPLGYLALGVVIMVFAVGYGAMSGHVQLPVPFPR